MLCRSGFPRSYRGTSASASGVLGLKVRIPKPHLQCASFFFFQTGLLFVTVLAVIGTHFVDQPGLQLTEICLPLCLLSVGIKGVPSMFFKQLLCSFGGCPGIHSVDQGCPGTHTDLPLSAFRVLGLKASVTPAWPLLTFFFNNSCSFTVV